MQSKPSAQHNISERRASAVLTEEQIEEIAERAAQKAVIKLQNEIYQSVGKGIIGFALSKLHWIIGALVTGFVVVGVHNGWIKV